MLVLEEDVPDLRDSGLLLKAACGFRFSGSQLQTWDQLLLDAQHSWSASYSAAAAQLQYNTDAAASATATVKPIFCAELCGICISLGVSGVTDTLMPK